MNDSKKTKSQLVAELKEAHREIAELTDEAHPSPFEENKKIAEVLMANSPVCHKIIDLDLNLQYMNPPGFEMLQLKVSNDLYGKPYPFDFFPDESRRRLRAELQKTIRLQQRTELEDIYCDSTGNEAWLYHMIVPIKDEHGSLSSLAVVTSDTTERKRFEKERNLLQARLQALWNIARMTDATYKKLCDTVLEEIQKLTGSEFAFFGFLDGDEEIMTLHAWSKSTMDVCAIQDRTLHFPIRDAGLWAEAVVERKPCIFNDTTLEHPRKRGLPIGHVHLSKLMSIPILQQGKVIALAAVANKLEDYTDEDAKSVEAFASSVLSLLDKRKAEEEVDSIKWMLGKKPQTTDQPTQAYGDLTELNTKRTILDAVGRDILADIASSYLNLLETSSAVYESNGDYALGIFTSGWCQYMDQASRNLCACKDDSEALSSGKWLCHESCWTEASKVAIETGKPADIACKGGIHLYAVPIKAGETNVGAINFGYGTPPTDKEALKELAEVYQVSSDELALLASQYKHRPRFIIDEAKERLASSARLIGEVVAHSLAEDQLRITKGQAEAANKAKSEFLANMSHEIRTPMNGVLGMLQLLQTTNINEEQREYILTAIQSSKRLTRLLSDILDLSRVEADRLSIQSQPLDLAEVVDQTCEMFKPMSQQTQVELSCHVHSAIPRNLNGDAARLQQVLTNIIGNSFKFTREGRISVEVYPVATSDANKARVLFSVTDTGIGIPDEMADKLFKPFSQASEGYRRSYQGAGLGLSICKKLVELMGGNIAFESEPGKGTTVHFCITFSMDEHVLPREAASSGRTKNKLFRILLAEDEDVNRLATAKLLEKHGHTVKAVKDGQEAIALLKDDSFDLILMDIQMPVMDGVEATKAIRGGDAGQGKKDISIIAMTAYAMGGDKEKFMAAGMNGYIAKPVDVEQLEALLQKVLSETDVK